MSVQSCPNISKQCLPCDEAPTLNLSAEAPDYPDFLGMVDWYDPPPIGNIFASKGCLGWVFSRISQADANTQALQQAQLCNWTDNGPPNIGCNGGSGICGPVRGDNYSSRRIYSSRPQSCTAICPDGSLFTYTLPSGAVLSLRSQSDADARALALCRRRVNAKRICLLDELLPDGTVGQNYPPEVLLVDGGVQPYHFTIIGGLLPTGLVLTDDGVIEGTPVVSGDFPFTVKVTDSQSDPASNSRAFTIHVNPSISWTVTPAAGAAGAGIGGACTGVVTVQSDHGPLKYTNDARTNNIQNSGFCFDPCGIQGLSSTYQSSSLGPFLVPMTVTLSGTVILQNAVFISNQDDGGGCHHVPRTQASASIIQIIDSVAGTVATQADSCLPGESPKTIPISLQYILPAGRTVSVNGVLNAWGAGMISTMNMNVGMAP